MGIEDEIRRLKIAQSDRQRRFRDGFPERQMQADLLKAEADRAKREQEELARAKLRAIELVGGEFWLNIINPLFASTVKELNVSAERYRRWKIDYVAGSLGHYTGESQDTGYDGPWKPIIDNYSYSGIVMERQKTWGYSSNHLGLQREVVFAGNVDGSFRLGFDLGYRARGHFGRKGDLNFGADGLYYLPSLDIPFATPENAPELVRELRDPQSELHQGLRNRSEQAMISALRHIPEYRMLGKV